MNTVTPSANATEFTPDHTASTRNVRSVSLPGLFKAFVAGFWTNAEDRADGDTSSFRGLI